MTALLVRVAPLAVLLLVACAHPRAEGPAPRPLPADVRALPAIDRALVYRLDPEMKDGPAGEGAFPIRPYYMKSATIVERKELAGAPARELADAWRGLSFDDAAQFLCHHPVIGLRLYSAGELVFETSICFTCRNFYDGNESWRGFDVASPSARVFYDKIRVALPSLPSFD